MKPQCPSTETLSAYLAGELPPERSAGVVAHAAQCGVCDNLLERMKAFDEPIEGLPEREWRRLEQDLAADFKRRLPKTHPPERRSRLRAWLWSPALGYAVAALLAFPAARWFLREPVSPQPQPPAARASVPSVAAWIPTLELSPTRDAQRAAAPLAPSDEFVLRFFVPSKKGTRYSAEIRNSAGKSLVTVHDLVISDDRGSLSLLCRRQAFPPGDYKLAVTEMGGIGEPALFSFHL